MQIKESSRPISSSLTSLKLRLKKFLLEPITVALSIAWLGLVDNREDDWPFLWQDQQMEWKIVSENTALC